MNDPYPSLSKPNSTVLSIDIDFFVSPTVFWRSDRNPQRIRDEDYDVWSESDVRQFVETRCSLSLEKQVPGSVITSHHEAFDLIMDGIRAHRIVAPIDLFHVDAHSDTGHGDGAWLYILKTLLHQPLAQRTEFPRGGLQGFGSGNWLAFCIANRWIRQVCFLPPKHYFSQRNGSDDLVDAFFPDQELDPSGAKKLELVPIPLNWSMPINWNGDMAEFNRTEPIVPWRTVTEQEFLLPAPPDYVIVCQSPGFTPPKADMLLEVIASYLNLSK